MWRGGLECHWMVGIAEWTCRVRGVGRKEGLGSRVIWISEMGFLSRCFQVKNFYRDLFLSFSYCLFLGSRSMFPQYLVFTVVSEE